MNKTKKIWIGLISLLLALLLFVALMIVQKSAQKKPESVWVLCAKERIPENVVLDEKNISLYTEKKEIPVMWLPEDYFEAEDELEGLIAEVSIAKGSILSETDFFVYSEYYEKYQELSWISVPIEELYEGVAGSLRPGDCIDIYLLKEENGEYFCEILEESVLIAATYSSQGVGIDVESEDGLCQLLTIPIEKEKAAGFYEKLAQGNIRIAKHEVE